MILVGLIAALVFAFWRTWGWAVRIDAKEDRHGYAYKKANTIASYTVALCVVGAAFLITNLVAYTNQLGDLADLDKTYSVERVYKQRAEDLGAELEHYLVEAYPAYERAVISEIMRSNPDLILLRFPELRTSDTFIRYTDQLTKLKRAVYAQQRVREEIRAGIQARERNHLAFFTPILP